VNSSRRRAKINSSFAIQLVGGLMTISTNFKTLQNGLHIYTAGVALQESFIFCFLFLVFVFQHRLSKEESDTIRIKGAKKLLLILYASLGLIAVRTLPPNMTHCDTSGLFRGMC